MNVKTSLNFFGRTEDAVRFYERAIDARILFLMPFRDAPVADNYPAELQDKIFHATFRVGDTEFMASDVGCHDADASARFEGFSLAISANDVDHAQRYFAALAEGGSVLVPMQETFFADCYGIVTDRFGVTWKILVEKSKPDDVG